MKNFIKGYLYILSFIFWTIFICLTLAVICMPGMFPDLPNWAYWVNYSYLIFIHIPLVMIWADALS